MEDGTLNRVSALFSALGHPTRIQIVRQLSAEPLKVTTLAERLSIAQSSASQHLSVLERVGILKAQAVGTSRYYGIRGPRVVKLLETAKEFCEAHGLSGFPDGGGDWPHA